MQSKLGVSTSVLACVLYLFGLVSGYVALALAAGYVLLFEEDEWLRTAAVKAVVVCLVFSAANVVIYLIPEAFGCINSLLEVFGGYVNFGIITNVFYFVADVVDLIETLVLLLLAFTALGHADVPVPIVDDLVKAALGRS